MASDSSRQLSIGSIQDLNNVRNEYKPAVVNYVNAIMLVEVLGPPRIDERMAAICKGFGDAKYQLGRKLTRLSERCSQLGGLLPLEFWLYHYLPDESPLKTYPKAINPGIPSPRDVLTLGDTCDLGPSINTTTVISLLFDNVRSYTLLYAADCVARSIVQRAAGLYDLSEREARRLLWIRQETVKQLHELWDNSAAPLFDISHSVADDGSMTIAPSMSTLHLPRPPRPVDRDPALPTSMCEPAKRGSAALTWTLRMCVVDQYWRYLHDVERTLEVFYGRICVAVETRPFVQRRREQQKHKLHSKLSSTNIRVILKDRQLY